MALPKKPDYAPDNINYAPKNQDYAPGNLNYASKNQDYALRKIFPAIELLNCQLSTRMPQIQYILLLLYKPIPIHSLNKLLSGCRM